MEAATLYAQECRRRGSPWVRMQIFGELKREEFWYSQTEISSTKWVRWDMEDRQETSLDSAALASASTIATASAPTDTATSAYTAARASTFASASAASRASTVASASAPTIQAQGKAKGEAEGQANGQAKGNARGQEKGQAEPQPAKTKTELDVAIATAGKMRAKYEKALADVSSIAAAVEMETNWAWAKSHMRALEQKGRS